MRDVELRAACSSGYLDMPTGECKMCPFGQTPSGYFSCSGTELVVNVLEWVTPPTAYHATEPGQYLLTQEDCFAVAASLTSLPLVEFPAGFTMSYQKETIEGVEAALDPPNNDYNWDPSPRVAGHNDMHIGCYIEYWMGYGSEYSGVPNPRGRVEYARLWDHVNWGQSNWPPEVGVANCRGPQNLPWDALGGAQYQYGGACLTSYYTPACLDPRASNYPTDTASTKYIENGLCEYYCPAGLAWDGIPGKLNQGVYDASLGLNPFPVLYDGSECVECPADHYSAAGYDLCTPQPLLECGPGQGFTSGGVGAPHTCTPCGDGEYEDGTNTNACQTCPAGSHTVSLDGNFVQGGAVGCVPCAHMTHWDRDGVSHTACETTNSSECGPGLRLVGTDDTTADNVCVDCPLGTFKTVTSVATECTPWTACTGTKGVAVNGTAVSDQLCCEPGEHPVGGWQGSCVADTVWHSSLCDAGSVFSDGGPSAEGLCTACAAATHFSPDPLTPCQAYKTQADCADGATLTTVANGISDKECIVLGCTDPSYLEYNPAAVTSDGSCSVVKVEGCMDSAYVEYSAASNFDDGSCTIFVQKLIVSFPDKGSQEGGVSYEIFGANGNLLSSGNTDGETVSNVQSSDGTFPLTVSDSGDGWNGAKMTISWLKTDGQTVQLLEGWTFSGGTGTVAVTFCPFTRRKVCANEPVCIDRSVYTGDVYCYNERPLAARGLVCNSGNEKVCFEQYVFD